MALSDDFKAQGEHLAVLDQHIEDLANSAPAILFPVVYERDKCSGDVIFGGEVFLYRAGHEDAYVVEKYKNNVGYCADGKIKVSVRKLTDVGRWIGVCWRDGNDVEPTTLRIRQAHVAASAKLLKAKQAKLKKALAEEKKRDAKIAAARAKALAAHLPKTEKK